MKEFGISGVLENAAVTISYPRMSTKPSVHQISSIGQSKCMQSFVAKMEAPDFETHWLQPWMTASNLGFGGSARLAHNAMYWRIGQLVVAIWHAAVAATSALSAEDPRA